MSRIGRISLAIRILRGNPPPRCPFSVSTAIEWLRMASGQDFGDDAEAWSNWLKKNRWAYYRSLHKN